MREQRLRVFVSLRGHAVLDVPALEGEGWLVLLVESLKNEVEALIRVE
jgi:hypothetical protein